MKIQFIIWTLLLAATTRGQERLITRNGNITLYSTSPVENIEAKSQTMLGALDKNTGALECVVLIKSFGFEKALMQEHFNENYLESDKYPKAIFKGNLNDPGKVDFARDGSYTTSVTGMLTIHGVTNSITVPVAFMIENGVVSAMAEFSILLADYKIRIPSITTSKITVRLYFGKN